jgi:YD repeat-containing protein
VPAGGTSLTSYNDAALTKTMTLSFTGFGITASQSSTNGLDGWGRTVVTQNSYGGQVNTTYDPFDRAITVSNPFPVGGSPAGATAATYDPLGRVITVTLADGNVTQTSYSGATTTVTDQVGRQRQYRYDGFGQLIQVLEQNPTGALS